jgi:hypothetical protein
MRCELHDTAHSQKHAQQQQNRSIRSVRSICSVGSIRSIRSSIHARSIASIRSSSVRSSSIAVRSIRSIVFVSFATFVAFVTFVAFAAVVCWQHSQQHSQPQYRWLQTTVTSEVGGVRPDRACGHQLTPPTVLFGRRRKRKHQRQPRSTTDDGRTFVTWLVLVAHVREHTLLMGVPGQSISIPMPVAIQ